jgi:hypothetical protein
MQNYAFFRKGMLLADKKSGPHLRAADIQPFKK